MSEENKELIRRWYRDFNAHDLDAVGKYFDEPFASGIQRGNTVYLTAFPDMHVSIEELIAEDDKVVVRGIFTGTQDAEIKGVAPTGRSVSVDFAEIHRVKDGRIVHYWCQMDVAGLLRQLTEDPALAPAMG